MRNERYRCVKPFSVCESDDDGGLVENGMTIEVRVGSVYEMRRPGLNLDVWLISENGWLDLDEETFQECFERVNVEANVGR